MAKITLTKKISEKIRRSRRNVFLRSDFNSISDDYDQVGRSLRQLVKANQLIKVGYGLYAKARINSLTGKAMIAAPGGFDQVAKEALNRLEVKYQDLSKEISDDADVTQVPVNTTIRLQSRFNRTIAVGEKLKLKVA